MQKRIVYATLILALLASSFIIFNQNTSLAATTDPASLRIFIGPSSVLADNKTYNCIFVQLQDSTGKPARALQDTAISLSSSLTNIGTVDPSIAIPKGATFASLSFYSTFSPGTTAISASATGYTTVQSSITTIGPIPNSVSIYGFPSTLPADGNTYNAIMVQLQDSSGSPAKAPKGGVPVSLSFSDTVNVGNVTQSVTIPEGKTFATANFTTKLNSTRVQSAIITTVAQGYTSQQLTISTTPVGSNPSQIRIFVGPSQIPSDENSCPQIAIQLQNATGCTAVSSSDTVVSVASTDPTVGQINSQVIIPANQTYAIATLNSTYKAGTTTITAVATNLLRGQQAITTTGFTPSKLAVYCAPTSLPSDRATYQTIQVQLQDSQGRPAKDPQADVNINLFSSQPTVGAVSSTLTIPFGQTQATGTITVTNTAGSTTITAQASSYTTGQGTITTYTIDFSPMQITASANSSSVYNGQKADLTVYITADNTIVTGATVQFTSDNGGTFAATSDQGNGTYTTTFTAPSFTKSTTCTITATATKTNYITSQATTQITVQPAPTPTPAPTATPVPTATPTPTPTPSTNSSETSNSTSPGTIQILVLDTDGSPLNNATVTSTTQPEGTDTLSNNTDSTGYVTFTDVATGQYSFKISKDETQLGNIEINFTGQPVKKILDLSRTSEAATANSSDSLALLVIVVVVVVVILLVIVVLLLKRRRSSVKERFKPSSFQPSEFKQF
jgi:hypothetical protein